MSGIAQKVLKTFTTEDEKKFFKAIEMLDKPTVVKYLDQGFSVNFENGRPLEYATELGSQWFVGLFLAEGANPDLQPGLRVKIKELMRLPSISGEREREFVSERRKKLLKVIRRGQLEDGSWKNEVPQVDIPLYNVIYEIMMFSVVNDSLTKIADIFVQTAKSSAYSPPHRFHDVRITRSREKEILNQTQRDLGEIGRFWWPVFDYAEEMRLRDLKFFPNESILEFDIGYGE